MGLGVSAWHRHQRGGRSQLVPEGRLPGPAGVEHATGDTGRTPRHQLMCGSGLPCRSWGSPVGVLRIEAYPGPSLGEWVGKLRALRFKYGQLPVISRMGNFSVGAASAPV